ncbi:MAG TPA: hypothetical protein VE172_20545 [Stackebrandtia sp.]|jgi:hypothetical protein|uniref:hypothetical protein n=1 Tax=Stackebrandtia sp. TaxID=2023065 RepID=UPI002D42DB50|nr:hypothetical protein [Stackebrandtia sp.]HZE41196.1 hypothetical protein [Stackebrandtia sp.]
MKRLLGLSALALGLGILSVAGTANAAPGLSSTGSDSLSFANVKADDLAHVQVCGINVADQTIAQACDNSDGIGAPSGAGSSGGRTLSAADVDVSHAGHLQVCGVNVLSHSKGAVCDNRTGAADDGTKTKNGITPVNVDGSGAAHWQVCGVTVAADPAQCDNGSGE